MDGGRYGIFSLPHLHHLLACPAHLLGTYLCFYMLKYITYHLRTRSSLLLNLIGNHQQAHTGAADPFGNHTLGYGGTRMDVGELAYV